MKTIKTMIIDNNTAKLVLLDDNTTVQIIYNDKVISSSGKNTWNNIKNDEWAQSALLEIEALTFIEDKKIDELINDTVEEYFK